VAREEFVDGANLDPRLREGADEAREFGPTRRCRPAPILKRKELEWAVGFA